MVRHSPDRLEPLRRLARLMPGGMALGRRLRRMANPDLREIARLQAEEADSLLQPFPDTSEERYPELFDALADRLVALPAPRILSFGCSSGAEVRALKRRMPGARIVGLDLNRRALAQAKAADPASDYRCAAAPEPGERFDAILAMAVLRHGQLEYEQPKSCAAVMPFARFAQVIAQLDAALEPGGWLAIGHAHFRFADWFDAVRYQADEATFPVLSEPALLYGHDNRRIEQPEPIAVLQRKLGS
jgi:trans-aconitate methyltransferase